MDQSQATDVVDLLLKIAGLVIPFLLTWGIAVLQKRTNMQITEQQRQTILHSAETAAGELIQAVMAGRVSAKELSRDHQAVRAMSVAALRPVADSAKALKVDTPDMSRIVMGKVGNKLPSLEKPPVVLAPTKVEIPN